MKLRLWYGEDSVVEVSRWMVKTIDDVVVLCVVEARNVWAVCGGGGGGAR